MTTEITIPGDGDNVQKRIEEALHACGFSERDIFAIKLAVEEALVNAVHHGNRADPDKRVHVSFTATPERFDIRITDEGEGFTPEDDFEVPGLYRPAGRGILLMRGFMDEVQFHGAGNVVTMSKVRSAPG